ncbi:hypothetical protein HID58_092578, partial [Brassica napus]
ECRPSYGWRSLLYGRELLIKGLQKRIGNGEILEGLRAPWITHNGFEINKKSGVISKSIQAMNDAQLLVVSRNYNRGTSFIAKSVIRENRHLYVASGPPGWLFELFINESRDF